MPWSLLNDFVGMEPAMFRAFGPRGWRQGTGGLRHPMVNVYGNDERLLITAEVSGIGKEDFEINVVGRTLTIKGARKEPELGEDSCYTCHERIHGEFERSITLPYEVDAGTMDANYVNGVLLIHATRTERDKPRKIAVKAG